MVTAKTKTGTATQTHLTNAGNAQAAMSQKPVPLTAKPAIPHTPPPAQPLTAQLTPAAANVHHKMLEPA